MEFRQKTDPSVSISSVILFLMERIFLFSMTALFCSNTYLLNMYDHVTVNEKNRIYVVVPQKCSFTQYAISQSHTQSRDICLFLII